MIRANIDAFINELNDDCNVHYYIQQQNDSIA